jgi:nucleotide-binding universal stress UspA family protein
MIKDIIVNLSVQEDGKPAEDYAVALASALEAHITGIAFTHDPTISLSDLGYVGVQAIEQRSDNEAAARAVMDRFSAASARAGISIDLRMLSASRDSAGDQFARIARHFDLAIVGQTKSEWGVADAMISKSTLFESGRPVIVVPYIQKAPLKFDRVMVCWDSSRPAARAVADAMPLLERAKRVEVTIVTNGGGRYDEIEGVDMGQHLARRGLNVEVNRIARGDINVADALLSHAADSSVDFIVMGGYGHSRLREFVLGGVTRSIFRSMTVPTLMSH